MSEPAWRFPPPWRAERFPRRLRRPRRQRSGARRRLLPVTTKPKPDRQKVLTMDEARRVAVNIAPSCRSCSERARRLRPPSALRTLAQSYERQTKKLGIEVEDAPRDGGGIFVIEPAQRRDYAALIACWVVEGEIVIYPD
jgi:hypothetical protein